MMPLSPFLDLSGKQVEYPIPKSAESEGKLTKEIRSSKFAGLLRP
jgi:hypothetical protein